MIVVLSVSGHLSSAPRGYARGIGRFETRKHLSARGAVGQCPHGGWGPVSAGGQRTDMAHKRCPKCGRQYEIYIDLCRICLVKLEVVIKGA